MWELLVTEIQATNLPSISQNRRTNKSQVCTDVMKQAMGSVPVSHGLVTMERFYQLHTETIAYEARRGVVFGKVDFVTLVSLIS